MFTNQEFDQVVASGLPQVILPMLIVFCIVYLILLQSKALGEHKGTNVMVSLVMSLILGVPHILGVYPKDFNPIIIMNNIIGGFALFIFGILIAVIVLTFIVKDPKKFLTGANYGYFIPLIILAYIAHAFPHLLPFTFGIIIILGGTQGLSKYFGVKENWNALSYDDFIDSQNSKYVLEDKQLSYLSQRLLNAGEFTINSNYRYI